MGELRSTLLATVAVFVAIAAPSHAALVGATCTAGKIGAAGKKASAKLNCHQKAARKGEASDPACITRAEDKFDAAFARTETQPPCYTTGDAGAIAAKVDSFVSATVTDLRPVLTASDCGSGQLKAAQKKAKAKLACHQKAARKGVLVEAECLTRAEESFDDHFADAVAEGDCLSSSTAASIEAAVDAFIADVADDLRPGPLSVCTGEKLKRTGHHAYDKLECHGFAAADGVLVDSACLATAENKFSTAFTVAETAADCLMLAGDLAAIETLVDAFVTDVETALRPVLTGSECASKKLVATGKETFQKLFCRATSIRHGLPAATSCASGADVAGFAKAEDSGDCLTTGDAAALEGMIDAFVASAYAGLVGPPGPTTTTTTTTTTTIPPTSPPCVVSGAPACDGFCTAPGEVCIDPGGSCVCVLGSPFPCGAGPGPPLCLGDCPPFMACVDVLGSCVCLP